MNPNRESGPSANFRLRIVQDSVDKAGKFLTDSSPDPALIRLSRPESVPDRKSSLEKGRYVSSVSRRKSARAEVKGADSLAQY
jgi:hypothetical protein